MGTATGGGNGGHAGTGGEPKDGGEREAANGAGGGGAGGVFDGGSSDAVIDEGDAGQPVEDADAGETTADAALDGRGLEAGAPPPSCAELAPTCGPHRDTDCCRANNVPGETFKRERNTTFPATVSDFRLDQYEVTVGRFRKFVALYPGNRPAAGAGKNPHDPTDGGWDAAWNAVLPVDRDALSAALACDRTFQTWAGAPGANESRPINCVSWHEAYAFCIWDGGRLPTEAEWLYAAVGGTEQRQMPWGNGTFDATFASYWEGDCLGDGQPGCTVADLVRVGSKSPKGDGRWGQSDLAGNVWEWTVDTSGPYTFPCNDCANRVPHPSGSHVVRGGGYFHSPGDGITYRLDPNPLGARSPHLGIRCARP